jgi:predicted RNA-binding Zn-ribbon protein involved in translation (DUF1610 family)
MRLSRRLDKLEKAHASRRCAHCGNRGGFLVVEEGEPRPDDPSRYGCPGCGKLTLIRVVLEQDEQAHFGGKGDLLIRERSE